jgi:hypothetical protein
MPSGPAEVHTHVDCNTWSESNFTGTLNVAPGGQICLNYTAFFDPVGSGQEIGAWINLNRDGDFNDPGETGAPFPTLGCCPGTYQVCFTIPLGTTAGPMLRGTKTDALKHTPKNWAEIVDS